ncbi:NUDIX hydrolase [Alloiococcus sp. CFN-8]|uniref:NUDIX hydrolase n=1 Tax=Alloiococcus sp. CFN-8 TaxID=3416081 RepID=UPI003CF8E180
MYFKYQMGNDGPEDNGINRRIAARGIIESRGKLLMIKTNRGDYKFPGGGVQRGESQKEALVREIEEETGYKVKRVIGKIGVVKQVNPDNYTENCTFQMYSNYYLCSLSEEKGVQNLEEYEKKLGYKPYWIDIDKALEINEKLLAEGNKERSPWIERETRVLRFLKKNLKRKEMTKEASDKLKERKHTSRENQASNKPYESKYISKRLEKDQK